eukprot:1160863-Pelagomonas_calceolata.AAC.5
MENQKALWNLYLSKHTLKEQKRKEQGTDCSGNKLGWETTRSIYIECACAIKNTPYINLRMGKKGPAGVASCILDIQF